MSAEQPPKSATRLLTGRFWAIFVLIVLPPAACGVALDAHKVAWYTVFPYTYYIEIKTDLTVDGEPVEVTGVAECKWVARLKPIITPHIIGSGWDRRGGIVAKRLPSGGAVIALVNVPCGARGDPSGLGGARKGFWKTARPLYAYFGNLPIQTLLLDDADEPTRIERSYSKAYFADSRARVHYLGGTYLPKRRARRPDPRDEVPWLRVEDEIKRWVGFYAKVTPLGKEAAQAAGLVFTETTELNGKHLSSLHGVHLTEGTVRSLFLKDGYWDYRPGGPEPDSMTVLYPRRDPVTGEIIPLNRYDNIFAARSRLSVNGQPTDIRPSSHSLGVYVPESASVLRFHKDTAFVASKEIRFSGVSNTLSGNLFKF